jgi:ABC-type transport system involved in multi-copper enzyme maturation permease subunit
MNLSGRALNPVLARELKERMRGKRAFVILTVYLAVLAIAAQLIFRSASRDRSRIISGPDPLAAASVGRSMFETLLTFMVVLVLFIVPGMTAGAIAGERERRTLAPLQVTLMSPRSILSGKLMASLAFGVYLVLAALPLVSVSYIVGGVTIMEVVRGIAMVLIIAVTIACIALACSTFISTVQPAILASYTLVLALLAGTFLVYGAETLLRDTTATGPSDGNKAVLVLNPLFATADIVRGQTGALRVVNSPLTAMQNLVAVKRVASTQSLTNGLVTSTGGAQVGTTSGGRAAKRSPWHAIPFWSKTVIIYTALSVLAFVLSVRRLRTPNAAGMFT